MPEPTSDHSTSDESTSGQPAEDVVAYVTEHAPELSPQDVSAFMNEHARPQDEPSHLAWAVRVLRERGEGEFGDGLPVDQVVRELRRRER